MKNVINKIKVGILFLVLGLVTFSCKDFLTENPQNTVSQSNYYKTEQDAVAAVNAIYSTTARFGSPPIWRRTT
jgi:hypothetical protein